jgi:DNA-binding PadR family transcriptional regulator
MEINEYTHTALAVASLYGTWLLGRFWESRKIVEKAIGITLDNLEKEGLIRTRLDEDGEKDIIPISEIIAKATRDAITK